MNTNKIHIGTSGWHYKHWIGTYYPPKTKPHNQLGLYQKDFDTVEINNSFYRLPSIEVFSTWKESVPENFQFAVKASRYITHMKKLVDPTISTNLFFKNVSYLEEKFGPILFQLPPFFKLNFTRLEEFLKHLPTGFLYTFEFRNPSWYTEQVYELLSNYNCAFCIYEIDRHLSPVQITSSFIYVRLHGPEGKYQGSYSDIILENWAHQCKKWIDSGKQVYMYFDNDQFGYAAFNAKKLRELIGHM